MANRGDGAALIDLYAGRWVDFSCPVTINNDLSGASFAAQIRLYPDAPGSAVQSMTVSTPAIAGGVTSFVLSLTDTQMGALPVGGERGSTTVLAWDLVMTLGGIKKVLFAGKFNVLAGVTK